MKYFLLCISLFACIFASANNFWKISDANDINHLEKQIEAKDAGYFDLDYDAMVQYLSNAPEKFTSLQGLPVQLPLPNGLNVTVHVWSASIMAPELAAKYPEIQTYIAKGVDGKTIYGRLDYTPKGFHGMLFTDYGTLYIDPIHSNNNSHYISYYKHNFVSDEPVHPCLFEEPIEIHDQIAHETKEVTVNHQKAARGGAAPFNGETLRSYRLAVSATGEYTQFHGGTVADGLAAVVTTINRVTGVYERDLTITFVLVADNDLIIYTNPATDPFDNPDNPGQLLGENQQSISATIGTNNYDVGHVVGTDGSGLASFRVVCKNNSKAQGTTGRSNPIGDPFDIDYVAHEIGHQFGGSHTFNSNASSCASNWSGNNAYEPGSGTTIMAYAGICSPHNVTNNSDDMFHTQSFDQIVFYSTVLNGDDCPVQTATNNSIPVIQSVTSSHNIPANTPFELTAVAVDADGDALTYSWEQHDRGPQGDPNNPSGNAPLFRAFQPSTSPTRSFPQLSDILNNTQTLGEILPDYARDMQFRVVVRDNVAGGGATIYETVDLSVDASAGPFEVTSPNTNLSWGANTTQTVTWNVANTNGGLVNCPNVDILLSTNGGQSFDVVLASNVPNNGSFNITLPNVSTTEARIKIVCSNNIFFDISNNDFTIDVDCNSVNTDITINTQPVDKTLCVGQVDSLVVEAATPVLLLNYQWKFQNVDIPGATSSTLLFLNPQLSDGGQYVCEITNGCEVVQTVSVTVIVSAAPPTPNLLQNGTQLVSTYSGENEWYLDGQVIPGATTLTYNPTQAGTYTVSAVLNGCKSAPSNSLVYTSIADFDQVTEVLIYPNPSSNQFIVSIDQWDEEVVLSLINTLGQTVQSHTFKNTIEVRWEDVPKGVYLLELSSEGFKTTRKLIKE